LVTSRTAELDVIHGCLRTYVRALEDGDIGLAAELWATDEAVTFIHPRGHEHGWEQGRDNFYQATMFDRFATRQLRIFDVGVTVYDGSAWAEFYWEFQATFRNDGSPLTTTGRETQIYRKDGRGWVLVHVHYSSMPVTGDREGF
jgi:ketosteroid isomerase-like protein